MLTGQRPFTVASDKDEWYKLLYAGRVDLFWQKHEQDWSNGFSPEFKELVTLMLHVNPQGRLCMSDIIGHPWMQGEFPSE